MPSMRLALAIGVVCLSLIAVIPVLAQKEKPAAPSYTKSIKPILDKNCISCHQGDWAQGGLKLDSAEGIKKGGQSGKVITAKSASKSLLFQRMNGDKGRIMPPVGKLKQADLKIVKAWIDSGASFK